MRPTLRSATIKSATGTVQSVTQIECEVNRPKRNSPLCRIGVSIAVPILLLGGCLLMDRIPMSAARPPKRIRTIEDSRTWKAGRIMGKGTFESAGVGYTVMLAPAGRFLASAPSGYLFDQRGQFVDWTADMGDFCT